MYFVQMGFCIFTGLMVMLAYERSVRARYFPKVSNLWIRGITICFLTSLTPVPVAFFGLNFFSLVMPIVFSVAIALFVMKVKLESHER